MMELPSPLSHAYLITGGGGDSRAAFAGRLAAAYLCEGDVPPCGRCRACRKVGKGSHPDLSRTAPPPDKAEITVEQIRALRADAYVRPNEGRRKVYVIDPADAMNPAAQNALLKVLEEGPAYAAFLLVSDRPGKLLDTVRSRCELLSLPREDALPGPELLERAETLAGLLLAGDELACAQALVELELSKPKAEELSALLLETERAVSRRLAREPRRGARVLLALKTARENAVYRPGTGHTLGQIITRIF
ncbi:MAG: DNA polymerase III subunit [Oscillospiraceae bacterium]|nr:DNA polymerase III subunit [Oscillospiraceae bacterium]